MENDILNKDLEISKLKAEIELLKNKLGKQDRILEQKVNEGEYKTLYHNIPFGIMQYNTKGVILDCNELFVKFIGSSYEKLIGMNMFSTLKDEKLLDAIKKSLKDGVGEYKGLYNSVTADRSIKARILFKGVRDNENKIISGICIAEDTTEIENKQAALKKVQENYNLIFENTTDVYYRTKIDGTIQAISPSIHRLLLLKNKDNLVGKNVKDFYFDLADREKFVKEIVESEKLKGYRVRLKKGDGSPVTVEFNSQLLFDKDGNIESIVGVFYDVTHRIEAEKERSTNIWFFERLDKIDKILRNSLDINEIYKNVVVATVEDIQCDCVSIISNKHNSNSWKLEAYKTSKDYKCKHNPEEFFSESQNVDEIFDRILMYDESIIIDENNKDEINKISSDNSIKAQMTTSIHLNSGDSLVFCILHCKDNRVWNKHEKALFNEIRSRLTDGINTYQSLSLLHKSEEHHRTLIEATNEGYWEINTEGNTTVANNAMCNMIGFSMKEFIGKSPLVFVENESREKLKNIIFNDKDESTVSVEIALKHKSGSTIFSIFNITRRKDSENNIIGSFFFVTDISKQKMAIAKAEESDKLKSVFIKNISHEVRTPLNGIIGFLGLLNDLSISMEERKMYTKFVMDSSEQLTSVITDILEYSRIEANLIEAKIISFNLNDLLDELNEKYKNHLIIKKKSQIKLTLEKELPDDNCTIQSDKQKVKQILDSLLNNSIKYTEKGEIVFGYKITDKDNIRFFVSDTGIGIPESDRDIIFEKFRNGSLTTNAVYGGNGLGLSIAKSLTSLLSGYIWFDSEVGVGTQFYVNIPSSIKKIGEKTKYVTPIIISKYNWEDKKILIVDDAYQVYKLISIYLRETSSKYLYASNGKQAIEMCRDNKDIDIVLLDIQLPDIDGYEVMKAIKKIRSNLPVIAQTAFALDDNKAKTISAGFDDYITKPIYKNNLLELVSKHFNNS